MSHIHMSRIHMSRIHMRNTNNNFIIDHVQVLLIFLAGMRMRRLIESCVVIEESISC